MNKAIVTERDFMSTTLNRRDFIQAACTGAAALPLAVMGRVRAARGRPNVLFIMTDEQLKDTLGCYGNEMAITPAFDSIAARGVRADSCYATQPVCSPCRSSMVTGLCPNATGVVENQIPLPPDLFSWPRALHEQGYKTAHIGKWHLGVDPVPDYWDVWQGYNTGWKHWITGEPVYQKPGEPLEDYEQRVKAGDRSTAAGEEHVGRYRPDLETDHAIDFIRRCGDDPFLCWISYYPPHTPKVAPEEDVALHRGKFATEEQDIYHAMVHRLDKNVARLLATLDECGLRENTLIVVVSDHGENFPLRWNNHIKRLCYDQAANVPLILSWPGVLPEGRVVKEVVSVADLAPTILDLAGVDLPATVHGMSAGRLLRGDSTGWHEDVFIQNSPYRTHGGAPEGVDVSMRERCVVTDEWKLILNTVRDPELYRRHQGPPDTRNLFGRADTLEVTRDLAKRLGAWGEKTGDAMTKELIAQWKSHWTK
jgi:arylsulfatase A-like enzyme